jgi:hypothetical protein
MEHVFHRVRAPWRLPSAPPAGERRLCARACVAAPSLPAVLPSLVSRL